MGGPDAGQRPARGNGTVILRACEAISDVILRCEPLRASKDVVLRCARSHPSRRARKCADLTGERNRIRPGDDGWVVVLDEVGLCENHRIDFSGGANHTMLCRAPFTSLHHF
jgi:hypothetical protein